MPLQRLLPSVGAETTTTPYEFTKHSGTMEGSGKTPYESPSHVVTMEESKLGVDEKTERFQSSNSSKTHHTMSCSSFPLCLSSPWHGMFFCWRHIACRRGAHFRRCRPPQSSPRVQFKHAVMENVSKLVNAIPIRGAEKDQPSSNPHRTDKRAWSTKGVFIHAWKWFDICEYLRIMDSVVFWCATTDYGLTSYDYWTEVQWEHCYQRKSEGKLWS